MPKTTNLYTCGPTVYNYAHIGNLRSYVMSDIIYRIAKETKTGPVKWVINITDVDDKTIKNTIAKFGQETNVNDLKNYTDLYYKYFLQDLDRLNIERKGINFIKVSEVIPQIQDFIIRLIDKGYAYRADDGSTYFSIDKYQEKFGNYGKLVGSKFLEGKQADISNTQAQTRHKADEYDKDNINDFALWKARAKEDGNIFWNHLLLGEGRPGWHIECSAINYLAFNGESTDIHTGGVDLIFPHHTNEIAQSEALMDKDFAHQWYHSEHLLVEGQKMSKSLGNIYTLPDLMAKGFSPLAYRYLLLQANYKQQVNFTWESLESAQKGYLNLQKKIAKIKNQTNFWSRWRAKLSKEELTNFHNKLQTINTAILLADTQSLINNTKLTPAHKLALIKKYDQILGLNLA